MRATIPYSSSFLPFNSHSLIHIIIIIIIFLSVTFYLQSRIRSFVCLHYKHSTFYLSQIHTTVRWTSVGVKLTSCIISINEMAIFIQSWLLNISHLLSVCHVQHNTALQFLYECVCDDNQREICFFFHAIGKFMQGAHNSIFIIFPPTYTKIYWWRCK
jgi:Trk-type K+ transport system membrane component